MRKEYSIPPSARRHVGYGVADYGPYKNEFNDGPYRCAMGVSPRSPQPWAIHDIGGNVLVYVASERWAHEIVDKWNLKHAEWIMLKE